MKAKDNVISVIQALTDKLCCSTTMRGATNNISCRPSRVLCGHAGWCCCQAQQLGILIAQTPCISTGTVIVMDLNKCIDLDVVVINEDQSHKITQRQVTVRSFKDDWLKVNIHLRCAMPRSLYVSRFLVAKEVRR